MSVMIECPRCPQAHGRSADLRQYRWRPRGCLPTQRGTTTMPGISAVSARQQGHRPTAPKPMTLTSAQAFDPQTFDDTDRQFDHGRSAVTITLNPNASAVSNIRVSSGAAGSPPRVSIRQTRTSV